MSGSQTEKEASATVYLVEELGDARLLCEQTKKYVDRATKLIEESDRKDHFFEVAGDIIEGLPETVHKLDLALKAVALATNRLDYEEVKQDLPSAKADELEEVLDETRIRPVQRGNDMTPEAAVEQIRSLAASAKESGHLPVAATLKFIEALEDGYKTASGDATAAELESLAAALTKPPEGQEGPSRVRLAAVLRSVVARSLSEEAVLAHRVAKKASTAHTTKEAGAKPSPDAALELKSAKVGLDKILKGGDPKRAAFTVIHGLAAGLELMGHDAVADIIYRLEGQVASARFASEDVQAKEKDLAAASKLKSMEAVMAALDKEAVVLKKNYDRYKKSPEKYETAFYGFKRSVTNLQAALKTYENHGPQKWASEEETKESRHEKGKSVDPTKDMSPEDAKKWKENVDHDGSNIKSAAGPSTLRSLEILTKDHGGMVKDQPSSFQALFSGSRAEANANAFARDAVMEYPELRGGVVIEPVASGRWFVSLDKRRLPKFASDEKESRHEKGKSVDPTKDMSPEDAKKWKENVDHDGSNIKKTAGKGKTHIESKMQGWKSGDSEYLADMARGYRGHFKELMSAAETMAKKGLIKFDGATVTKTASEEESKESRHEEGKPADPTKDMSEEDAKKWKLNTLKHKDNFKDKEAKDWKTAVVIDITEVPEDKKQWAEELKGHLADFKKVIDGLPVPYKQASVSNIGGAHRASLMFTLGLDPKEEWSHGILENSYYAKGRVDFERGKWVLELFSGPASRKIRKYSSPDKNKVLQKIKILPKAMEAKRPSKTAADWKA